MTLKLQIDFFIVLFYRRRFVVLRRSRIESNSEKFKETISFDFVTRDRNLVKRFVKEAFVDNTTDDSDLVKIYIYDNSCWYVIVSRPLRPFDSVILDGNIAEELYEDMKWFFENNKWYSDLGIPYRRGYCLYGEPGTGKSSIVFALASRLKTNIALLNISDIHITDNNIGKVLNLAPASIILIEDVDAFFFDRNELLYKAQKKEEKTDENSNNKMTKGALTFSGFLNALDGVAAQEGKIIIMTTNHFDKLNPTMMRPGRCDYKQYIGNASKAQLEKIFLKFYPNHEKLAQIFSTRIPERKVSMSAVQNYLMLYNKNPYNAINNLNKLWFIENNEDFLKVNMQHKQLVEN